MEEKLNKVSELIDNANNIPEDIKPIVKAICRGYMRESNGSIPIEGIMNVCNTTFIKIDENDTEFSGENKIYGNTDVDYDKDGKVIHKMSYIHASNYIKLITILTHELGHVITEADQRPADEKGVYNFVKRTTDFYFTLFHNENNALMANEIHGFKLTDGFLESICTRIFASPEFRQELLESNYDLQDFVYKDERLFSSRVYDEYKACFELFDYVMDGALSRFSVSTSLPEIVDIINKYHLRVIFPYIDKSNDALNGLKKYEGKEANAEFDEKFSEYMEAKRTSLEAAKVLMQNFGKDENDEIFQRLYHEYETTIQKQKELPIPSEYLTSNEDPML